MKIVSAAVLVFLLAAPALSPAAALPAAPAGAAPEASTGAPRKIDLNRGTLPEFVGIPGIGEVMAQEILDLRVKKGAFSRLDELLEIRGIGPKKLAALEPYLTVGPAAAPAGAAAQAAKTK